MKRIFLRVLVLGIVLFLLPAGALAFNSYSLDVAALKAVEQEDTFEVKITRKLVTDSVTSGDLYNNDLLSFEITNSSSWEITKLTVLAVCHDEEGKAQQLTGSRMSFSIGTTSKRELQVLSFEPKGLGPGKTVTVSVACTHSQFSGVRSIVADYTTSSGEVFINPLVADWQEVALGSPTHFLD